MRREVVVVMAFPHFHVLDAGLRSKKPLLRSIFRRTNVYWQ
jgi:hypothetical protein